MSGPLEDLAKGKISYDEFVRRVRSQPKGTESRRLEELRRSLDELRRVGNEVSVNRSRPRKRRAWP